MSGGDAVIVTTAVLTFVGSIYATFRLARTDKVKAGLDSSAVLLGGWKDLQASLTVEVERVRRQSAEEVGALRAEHEKDRAEWAVEREAMERKIASLEAQILILYRQINFPPEGRP